MTSATIVYMIIGVDIGGTKTLIALFNSAGVIEKEHSFTTPLGYDEFISEFSGHIVNFPTSKIELCCVGVPGLLDRSKGLVHSLGNLPWEEEAIARDLSKCMDDVKVVIENDSKLAGLSEVRALQEVPHRALYLTISTGIGGALLVNGKLSKDMIDMEIGKTPVLFEGELADWETFASGKAFTEAYGGKGDEINNPLLWQKYAQERLGPGLVVACSYLQIDTIIFGGGLGHHSKHFADYLAPYLDERLHAIVKRPKDLRPAKHGKNAVIYGCYEYAKDKLT